MSDKQDKNTLEEASQEELPVEQVFNVLTFAKELAGIDFPLLGAITPQSLARAIKDVSFHPKEYTSADLTRALSNPKESEDVLRSFMEYLEIVSMPMKRVVSYMYSHLAFDLTYTLKKKDGSELNISDYSETKYKKDLKQINRVLDDFDWHGQFRKSLKQLIRNDIFVFSPRDDGDRITLQELPYDRCKITGKWKYGFVISFDFSYFLTPGVDIRMYPKFFRDKFSELFVKGQDGIYKPTMNPSYRGGVGSTLAFWVDVPPNVAWVIKMDDSIATSIPYFSGLMPEILDQPVIRALQKNANMAAASRMIVGQVPMRSSSAKQSVKDMIAIDAETLGKFLALLQSAISESIKVAAAPLENMKTIEFAAENEIYENYLTTALATSGLNSAVFFNTDVKDNTVETQLAFQSDSKIMEVLYSQFNFFMEYLINKEVKYHKVYPRYEGNDYYLDRKERFGYVKDLAMLGIVMPQKIAAARGIKPQDLSRYMIEAKATGFIDLLNPLSLGGNMPTEPGRPQSDDTELGEKGAETRDTGGNIDKGGDI